MSSRPLAHRDTTLRSPREIAAHLAFALYVVLPPLGVAAVLIGLTQPNPPAGWLGGTALAAFAALHLFARHTFGFAAIAKELKRNPFKPKRPTPSAPAPEQPAARCESGTCGLL